MLQAIEAQTIVDFIREDDELEFTGYIDDLLKYLARIQRPRGIVWIDDDDRFRLRCDFRTYVR